MKHSARRPRDPFVWQPGEGYAQAAVERLSRHFSKPAELMGEAWFMGSQRRMYPELAGDLSAIAVRDMQGIISEIYSGTMSFGRLPEWYDWYHYLLPRLVPRHREAWLESMLEYLIGAFFVLHPDGIDDAPYKGFRNDCFATLGQCIMDPAFWDQGEVRGGAFLHRSNDNPARIWGWDEASGDFSAAAFFCAKYLQPDEIEPWLKSVLSIRSAQWVAQVMVWLLGAHGAFTGKFRQPSEWHDRPRVDWAWSHVINGKYYDGDCHRSIDFIPQENCAAILRVLDGHLSEHLFFDWLDLIKPHPDLETELAELPSRFAQVYGIGD